MKRQALNPPSTEIKQLRREPLQPVGKRIAQLRQEHGWTQQALAERLAISRVAISHIEMDLTLPSERTVTLLAGIFKCTPFELVAGTSYPQAKAERLPPVACCYTPLENALAVLENDLAWLERLKGEAEIRRWRNEIWEKWRGRLETWRGETLDEREREMIAAARQRLAEAGGRSAASS